MLDEIVNLRAARHSLHDQQEVAFLAVARQQKRLDKIHPQVQIDHLTRLPNRIGLETALWQWWQEGYPDKHEMGVILLDLNGVRSLTRNLGSVACDHLLVAAAGVVGQLCGPPHLMARFAEHCFTIVMVNTGPQGLQKMGELLRQSIERMTFVSQGNQVAVAAHVGIAPVLPGESVESLLGRAGTALHVANQSEASRSCFDDGKRVEPVQPIDLRRVSRSGDLSAARKTSAPWV